MMKTFFILLIIMLNLSVLTTLFIKEYTSYKNSTNVNIYDITINKVNNNKLSNPKTLSGQLYSVINSDFKILQNGTNTYQLYIPIITATGSNNTERMTNGDNIYNNLDLNINNFKIKNGYSSIYFGKDYSDGTEKDIFLYLGKLYLLCNFGNDCNNSNNLYLR